MDTVQKIFKVKAPVQYKSAVKPVVCTNPELIAGVELETENASRDSDNYLPGVNISALWKVDRDNSLRGGDSAYEFISKPVQMQFLIPELTNFFTRTHFGPDNYSDRCSVHVHTNVTDYTQDMLASLCMVYTILEELLFQFVNFEKATKNEGYCRDTNLYCIPWNQCLMNHRLVEKIFHDTAHVARWQKYTALNLLPITTIGTVEWRHMHGTADMEKLTTWLNIIGSIMKYARKTSLDDVIKTVKTLNDTSAYRQFFTDVLQGSLEYKDAYQASLSAGVVSAKYALVDWDRSKKKKYANPNDDPDNVGSQAWARRELLRNAELANAELANRHLQVPQMQQLEERLDEVFDRNRRNVPPHPLPDIEWGPRPWGDVRRAGDGQPPAPRRVVNRPARNIAAPTVAEGEEVAAQQVAAADAENRRAVPLGFFIDDFHVDEGDRE